MAINWIAMAISAALAVGSAVVSAKAAAVTQRNVNRALIRGMDEQDAIDKKQREVVAALLPEVDQSAQDQFLTEEDKKIAASMAKTSKAGKKSRQTDIAIAGKLTSFKGERRASKKESEARYAEKRFHLARFLAPNAVALYLDPKLNESASEIREYGVQKGAAGRIANIDAQWQQHNSAGGLKALSTALSVASTLVAVGWGTTADAAAKTATVDAATKAAAVGGTQAGIQASKVAAQSALGAGSLSAGSKAAYSTLSGATQLAPAAGTNLLAPAIALSPHAMTQGITGLTQPMVNAGSSGAREGIITSTGSMPYGPGTVPGMSMRNATDAQRRLLVESGVPWNEVYGPDIGGNRLWQGPTRGIVKEFGWQTPSSGYTSPTTY